MLFIYRIINPLLIYYIIQYSFQYTIHPFMVDYFNYFFTTSIRFKWGKLTTVALVVDYFINYFNSSCKPGGFYGGCDGLFLINSFLFSACKWARGSIVNRCWAFMK